MQQKHFSARLTSVLQYAIVLLPLIATMRVPALAQAGFTFGPTASPTSASAAQGNPSSAAPGSPAIIVPLTSTTFAGTIKLSCTVPPAATGAGCVFSRSSVVLQPGSAVNLAVTFTTTLNTGNPGLSTPAGSYPITLQADTVPPTAQQTVPVTLNVTSSGTLVGLNALFSPPIIQGGLAGFFSTSTSNPINVGPVTILVYAKAYGSAGSVGSANMLVTFPQQVAHFSVSTSYGTASGGATSCTSDPVSQSIACDLGPIPGGKFKWIAVTVELGISNRKLDMVAQVSASNQPNSGTSVANLDAGAAPVVSLSAFSSASPAYFGGPRYDVRLRPWVHNGIPPKQ